MALLTIDTSNNREIKVGLDHEVAMAQAGPETPQEVIWLIQKLLQKQGISLDDIDRIQVETGPGSYTGLRVGLAVANALGFALGIPVNGQRIRPDNVIKPRYRG